MRVSFWQNLHFKKLADLIGSLVQVEFLKEDGTPRYKRPMWLFWTGPNEIALSGLCRMYLWRFAIEHMFRFFKQHMATAIVLPIWLAPNNRSGCVRWLTGNYF